MSIGLKIKEIRLKNNLTQEDFAGLISISRSSLGQIEIGKSNPTLDIITGIVNHFHIDANYLLSTENSNNIVNEPIEAYGIKKIDKGIPFIPAKAHASHNTFNVSVMNRDIEMYFNIPVLKEKADFVWQIDGNSMSPTFEHEDYIVCKIIDKSEFKWEKPYLISVNHSPMIKRLIPSVTKGNLICRSDNDKHRDFEVKESDITTIAKIIFPKRH